MWWSTCLQILPSISWETKHPRWSSVAFQEHNIPDPPGNSTVSSINLGASQHYNPTSKGEAPAERKQAFGRSAVSVPFNCKFGQALPSEVQNAARLWHWYCIRIIATWETSGFVACVCMRKSLLTGLFWINVEAINKVFSLWGTGFDLLLSSLFSIP